MDCLKLSNLRKSILGSDYVSYGERSEYAGILNIDETKFYNKNKDDFDQEVRDEMQILINDQPQDYLVSKSNHFCKTKDPFL